MSAFTFSTEKVVNPSRNDSGFTFLEIMIAAMILLVAILALATAIFSAGKLIQGSRNETIAVNAARQMIEAMRNYTPFSSVYTKYLGTNSSVQGLVAQWGAGGNALSVRFPVNATNNLREGTALANFTDQTLASNLGMPMDLNGDGAIDGSNHDGDYKLLPVEIRVAWTEGGRNRSITLRTILADRLLAVAASSDGSGTTELCHYPPGNPANCHTLHVSPNAVPAHLAHGDHLGPCP